MQQISNFLPMHPSQENYTECYLLLAKLALAMREEADLYNALYAVEVLDYLVDHCCFCASLQAIVWSAHRLFASTLAVPLHAMLLAVLWRGIKVRFERLRV